MYEMKSMSLLENWEITSGLQRAGSKKRHAESQQDECAGLKGVCKSRNPIIKNRCRRREEAIGTIRPCTIVPGTRITWQLQTREQL